MSRRKAIGFLLTALNTLGCSYFGTYLFFLLQQQHGFGNRDNLLTCALHGLIYVPAARMGGRFAERHGLTTSFKVGFLTMAAAMLAGGLMQSLVGVFVTLFVWTIGMCFTWPALEAHATHGETEAGTKRMVGIYNITWSGCAGLMYFLGGSLYEWLGARSLFWIPTVIFTSQLLLTLWLESLPHSPAPPPVSTMPHHPEEAALHQPISPETFLKMAWLANPFSYIAIHSFLAVVPGRSAELGLNIAQSGWFWSVWFLVRLGTFIVLWRWSGWRYRFRWMLAAFLGLIASYVVLQLGHSLPLLVAGQVLFGLATGLLYYSSLFYSMDVGDTQGEHGGIHEAAIGIGICLGPAVGAGALFLAPGQPRAGALGVSALLLVGLAGLLKLRLRR
ncbi:MAG: MFS transporter [Verrucomicrobia bacterium]|nr:MFS transporter [Verrucomicrobiota bacterium]NBU08431.1 MFS transporter [Pseudomonadota bacterium]NDA65981.1 MFS transporter [Verrucomicrobiota bacterium]NDB74404.1 MFS transporter [Verrucomicrobiota bacterium]NDD37828.1 MFS transporter [Verrucomicrobiota bacterium]